VRRKTDRIDDDDDDEVSTCLRAPVQPSSLPLESATDITLDFVPLARHLRPGRADGPTRARRTYFEQQQSNVRSRRRTLRNQILERQLRLQVVRLVRLQSIDFNQTAA
jgi:hypothetical protein